MATLREIKRRINSVKSTQQITKAMKMVAAAHLRKAQEKILATRPYAQKVDQMVHHILNKIENYQDPLFEKRDVEKILVVVVAADRGLCGGFNSNTLKHAVSLINSHSEAEVDVYPVGKKVFEYFSKRDYNLFDHKKDFFNQLEFVDALEITDKVKNAFLEHKYDQVQVVYNRFKSAVQQILSTEQILPITADVDEDHTHGMDFLYEPGKVEILSALIPKHLNIMLWKILLESNASEQGARMTAMENATENAEELISKLTLYYNRARQAAITKELLEIVAGAEALKEN